MQKKRLVVGISGASGAPIAVEVLRQLRAIEMVESHLMITKGGLMTLRQETGLSPEELAGLADVFYENDRIGAALASGSFATEGMLVVPCSMKTVAGIVSGYSDNLLLRAADVTLKERRKLVLVARESPLSSIHLRNMYELSRMGAVIMPPVMTYYRQADSVQEMTRNFVQRLLVQFGMKQEEWEWTGEEKDSTRSV